MSEEEYPSSPLVDDSGNSGNSGDSGNLGGYSGGGYLGGRSRYRGGYYGGEPEDYTGGAETDWQTCLIVLLILAIFYYLWQHRAELQLRYYSYGSRPVVRNNKIV
jgi:hypothetical protein